MVAAVASASKLVNACTSTKGDSAASAASHGRPRHSSTRAHTVTSQASASHHAVTSKYTMTGSELGSQSAAAQAWALWALTHWNSPVTTGYSMYRTCSSGSPGFSTHDVA